MSDRYGLDLPGWVPEPTRRYLAHTVLGLSLRDVARRAGCHPSTVMRQVRRVESDRDDPLVERAMSSLEATDQTVKGQAMQGDKAEFAVAERAAAKRQDMSAREFPVLSKLSEPGAVLAVAEAMDRAVVVREEPDGQTLRTAVIDGDLAPILALKGWIACAQSGRISRYVLTAAGRIALRQMSADSDSQALILHPGFAEMPTTFDPAPADAEPRRGRGASSDSPIVVLSRRRDRDGQPFLGPDLLAAAEWLRRDFVLAGISLSDPNQGVSDWLSAVNAKAGNPQELAHGRVVAALTAMGPGLADVVLRCCCHEEGLETVERSLGWSARSGKIVLRIGLQQLLQHYRASGHAGDMIG